VPSDSEYDPDSSGRTSRDQGWSTAREICMQLTAKSLVDRKLAAARRSIEKQNASKLQAAELMSVLIDKLWHKSLNEYFAKNLTLRVAGEVQQAVRNVQQRKIGDLCELLDGDGCESDVKKSELEEQGDWSKLNLIAPNIKLPIENILGYVNKSLEAIAQENMGKWKKSELVISHMKPHMSPISRQDDETDDNGYTGHGEWTRKRMDSVDMDTQTKKVCEEEEVLKKLCRSLTTPQPSGYQKVVMMSSGTKDQYSVEETSSNDGDDQESVVSSDSSQRCSAGDASETDKAESHAPAEMSDDGETEECESEFNAQTGDGVGEEDVDTSDMEPEKAEPTASSPTASIKDHGGTPQPAPPSAQATAPKSTVHWTSSTSFSTSAHRVTSASTYKTHIAKHESVRRVENIRRGYAGTQKQTQTKTITSVNLTFWTLGGLLGLGLLSGLAYYAATGAATSVADMV